MKSVLRKKSFRIVLVFFLLGISLPAACSKHHQQLLVNQPPASIHKDGVLNFVTSRGTVKTSIAVEIADTPETQRKGLMGRRVLDDGSGMLFVFKHVEPRKFWMKNTQISLDIIFVGKDGCIVNIFESTPPMSNQRYRSKEPIKYVVEVPAGFVKRYKIDSNTCIRWQRQ